ncbi:MAG: two-component regulator propeller domain-containing protein, partial [Bacteroidales bacterium]|nr:two-component regulator propeller domain-containing protein [Bacteroidales bacterium]
MDSDIILKINVKNLALLILCLLAFKTAPAQDKAFGIPQIEYFNRREYNAATQNWSISQSSQDILYFANNDGLLEYDGVEWKLFRDMGHFVVRSVKSIGDRIYAGAYGEFGYFTYKNNRDLRYKSLAVNDLLRSYEDYWNIHEWNDKIVFHSEQSLCVFKNDSLINVIPARSRFTKSFLVNDLLLVHDETEGLMEVRGEHIYPIAGGAVLEDKLITSILPLSENIMVIGTLTDGLYTWDMQGVSRWNVPANEVLKEGNIFCAVSYEDHYLVFGTIQSGMIIADMNGEVIFQIGKDKGLSNNTVLSLFVDKDGNVWGGLDNGIVKVNLRSSITFLQGYYDLGTGYAVSRLKNDWYFGTNQGLFMIDDEEFTDPLKNRSDFSKVSGTDGQVWSLYNTGETLLCGHNLGVFLVRGDEARLITPPTVNGAWIFRPVPGRDDLLVAGTYNGLILLEKINDFWEYKLTFEGFNESSRYLEWSADGKLWISHGYKGIFSLEFNDDYSGIDEVETYSIEDYPEIGPAPVIAVLDGEVVVTSSNGIHRVNNSGEIEKYTSLDEYFDGQYPDRIINDRFRNIWYFRNGTTGVLRFMEDESFKDVHFPFMLLENKLVPSFESSYFVDNDNVIFGVEDGFAHYSVREGMEFARPFKLHIRSFRGSSDTISYILNYNGGIAEKRQVVVPEYAFRDNSFEINYAAAYFREGYVEYSTYLSDYDIEASSWNSNTSRQFARLEEGNYDFVVKARNSFDVQSEPLVFSFRVMPPWHRTIAAKVVYVILCLMLILLIVYIINRQIEIHNRKVKIKQKEEYRAKEEKLKNEALETEKELIRIRNERLKSEMTFKEKELANSTMNILQKNKSLMKLKSEMYKISSLNDKLEMKKQIKYLVSRIEKDIDSEDYWKVFEVHLEQVHEAFLKRLAEKHP